MHNIGDDIHCEQPVIFESGSKTVSQEQVWLARLCSRHRDGPTLLRNQKSKLTKLVQERLRVSKPRNSLYLTLSKIQAHAKRDRGPLKRSTVRT